MQSIIFSDPISRIRNAPARAPFELSQCKATPIGAILALRQGSDLVPGTDDESAFMNKPWVKWDGEVVEDELLALDDHRGLLYACDASGIKIYPSNFSTDGVSEDVPKVVAMRVTNESGIDLGDSNETIKGLMSGSSVSYLVIPYNDRDEAGGFFWYSYTTHLDSGFIPSVWSAGEVTRKFISNANAMANFHQSIVPTFEIETNDYTSYIEIYRTTERFIDVFDDAELENTPNAIEGLPAEFAKISREGGSNSQYYYLGRTNTPEGTGPVEFVDSNFIPDPVAVENWQKVKGHEEFEGILSENLDIAGYGLLDRHISLIEVGQDTDASFGVGTPTFHNANREITAGTSKRFSAKAMFSDAGVMLYGNVTWPTKTPQAALLSRDTRDSANISTYNVKAQYEYSTDNGIKYGPVADFGAVSKLEIPFQGEQALLLYVDVAGTHKLLQRLITDGRGRYVMSRSANQYSGADSNTSVALSNLTFDAEFYAVLVAEGSPAEGHTPKAVTNFITEQNLIFTSEQDRPLEATFRDYLEARGDDPIIAITPARLAETESEISYSYYIFTSGRIFHGMRDRNPTVMSKTVGLASRVVDGKTIPIFALTLDGVAFAGTDNRVYHLRGRDVDGGDLTLNIPELWNIVYDLAYDPIEDEIYALTDTGTWIYSNLMRGWIGHFPGYDTFEFIQFDQAAGHVIAQIRANVTAVDQVGDEFTVDKSLLEYLSSGMKFRIGSSSGNDGVFTITSVSDNSGETDVAVSEEIPDATADGFLYINFLMDGSGPRYEASVTTQRLADGPDPLRLSEFRVDFDAGVKSTYASITSGTKSVTLDSTDNVSFDEDDEGSYIAIPGAGASGSVLISKIVSVVNSTTATIEDSASATKSEVNVLWPIASITHSVRSPRNNSNSFFLYPKRQGRSKLAGNGHQLQISRFDELREIIIESDTV